MSVVEGLSHVFMHVADIDRSVRFYSEVFGFELLFDETLQGPEFEAVVGVPDAVCRSVGGRIADLRLEFVDASWQPKVPASGGTGVARLSFQVPDAVAAQQRCEAMGVKTSGPPNETFGSRIFFLEDPDGQRLEMVEYPAGSEAWGGEGRRRELRGAT